MSNPTTHVSQFDGSAPGWTLVDPERYDGGLWLEEGGQNYFTNPQLTSESSGWSKFSSTSDDTSGTRVTNQPDMGDAAWEFEILNYVNGQSYLTYGTMTTPVVGLTGHITTSCRLKASRAIAGMVLTTRLYYTDTSQENFSKTITAPTVATRLIFPTGAVNPAKSLSRVDFMATVTGVGQTGDKIWTSRGQIDNQPYATSYLYGGAGSGYGWAGAADASVGTRAAASASLSPTSILSPDSGAVAFRVTPTIETGLEEIWGECGVKGSGTDHLRWGRDASKHPFVEWSANNAAYQRLTASETVDAGTAYDLYLGHDGTDVSLSVDAGTANTGTRASVSDSFGAGDLTLEASTGGVIYDEFATFDRTLTTSEIARLNAASAWSMTTVAARRIQQQFQLRPY